MNWCRHHELSLRDMNWILPYSLCAAAQFMPVGQFMAHANSFAVRQNSLRRKRRINRNLSLNKNHTGTRHPKFIVALHCDRLIALRSAPFYPKNPPRSACRVRACPRVARSAKTYTLALKEASVYVFLFLSILYLFLYLFLFLSLLLACGGVINTASSGAWSDPWSQANGYPISRLSGGY